MNKFFKSASWLLYLLSLLCFFIGGLNYAAISGAAEGQGLAGGAIVLGYGIMFALVGLFASILAIYLLERPTIIRINKILTVLIVLMVLLVFVQRNARQKDRTSSMIMGQNQFQIAQASLVPLSSSTRSSSVSYVGIGWFKPDLQSPLHFFASNRQSGNTKVDSILFDKSNAGRKDITYAPPWLAPDHLKLDYDIFFFRVKSLSRNYAEVYVNRFNGSTRWIALESGAYISWEEFLLNVHSVEFINSGDKVHIKPLDHSSTVNISYDFMTPITVTGNWLQVHLFSDQYEKTGEGWILWRKNDSLKITWSLLS